MTPDITDALARANVAYDAAQYDDAARYLSAALETCTVMSRLQSTLEELTAELDQRIESISRQ